MTIFSGYVSGSYSQFLAFGNPDLGNKPATLDYLAGYDPLETSDVRYGDRTNTQPILEIPRTHVGFSGPEFGFLDFYNRVHIQYTHINLGAVVSSQTVPFTVFNAFFVPRTLNDITAENDTGLVLTQPGTPPYSFNPLEEKSYSLAVSAIGPATVDAVYTFDFDNRDYLMEVTGIRVIGWRWEPNWSPGIRERLAWLTDVMTSYDSSEQRRPLREWPRQYWEFTFDLTDNERRIFQNVLHNWGARIWALPIWPDLDVLTTTVAAGSTTFPVDTRTRQYREGELIILISPANDRHETLEVDSFTDTEVTTTQPSTLEWGPGTRVYPARLAKLENAPQLSAWLRNYSYGSAQFRCEDGASFDSLTESVTYRGYPVLTDEPEWRSDPSVAYARKQSIIDLEIGRVTTVDEAEIPWEIFANNWVCLNRTEADRMRKWLYARRGRAKSLWVPTFMDDLVVKETITDVATNIDFENCGIAPYGNQEIGRRDIRIELVDGTVFYRRIANPVVIDDETERVSIDTPLGVTVTPAEVLRVSWMALCRLDADSIEIAWSNTYICESLMMLRSFRNGV